MSKTKKNKKTGKQKDVNSSATTPAEPEEYSSRKSVRINGRFLLILALILVALAGGTYALHSVQLRRNAESLLVMADDAEVAGESKKAIKYLQQYLKFQPDDYDNKIRVANLLETVSDDRRSHLYIAQLLEEVLRNDPDRTDAAVLRDRAVGHFRRAGNLRAAISHINELKDSTDKTNVTRIAELLVDEGRCYKGLGDYSKALLLHLEAMSIAPEFVQAYADAAAVLNARPDLTPFREDLEVKNHPQFDEAVLALFMKRDEVSKKNGENYVAVAAKPMFRDGGPIRSSVFQFEDSRTARIVAAIYSRMESVGKPRHKAYLLLASYYMYDQDYDASDRAINFAESHAADDPDVMLLKSMLALQRAKKARLEVRNQNTEKNIATWLNSAEKIAEMGASKHPKKKLQFMQQLVEIEFERSLALRDKAKKKVQHNLALAKIDETLSVLKAERETLAASDYKAKSKLLRSEVSLKTLELEVLVSELNHSEGAIKKKQFKTYKIKLDELIAIRGSRADIEIFQAKSLLAEHRWRDAIEKLQILEKTVIDDRQTRRQVLLAISSCYDNLEDRLASLQTLADGVKADPLWHVGRLRLAEMLIAQGRLREARPHFLFLIDNSIRGGYEGYCRVQLLQLLRAPVERRNYEVMDKLLRLKDVRGDVIPHRDTEDLAVLRAQFALADSRLAQETRLRKAEKLFQQGRARFPQSIKLLVEDARFTANRTDRIQAVSVKAGIKLLEDDRITDPEQVATLKENVARLATALRPKEVAVEKLAELEEFAQGLTSENRYRVMVAIARAYGSLDMPNEGIAIWKRIAADYRQKFRPLVAIATLTTRTQKGKLAESDLDAIKKIDGANSAWALYFDAWGILNEASKKFRDGRKELDALPYSLRDQARYRIKEEMENLLLKAKNRLEKGQRLQPNWPGFSTYLGRIAEINGDRFAAYRHYQRAIDLGSSSEWNFTYVATYLRAERQFDEANAVIEKARQVSAALVSADQINLKDNKTTLAEIALDIAFQRKNIGDRSELFSKNAQGYSQKVILADKRNLEYMSLPKLDRESKAGVKLREEVDKLYNEALSEAADFPRPWIIRVYQLARAKREADAEKLIQYALKTLNDDVRLAAVARCYAVLGKTSDAIRMFEASVKEQPADPVRRIEAAQYLFTQRKSAKAITHLDRVLADDSKATMTQRSIARRLRILAISYSGRFSDLAKAADLIGRVEKATVADLFVLVRIFSRSPLKKDRDRVIQVLEEIDRREPLNSKAKLGLARLYEKSGRWEDAKKLLEALIEKDPQNRAYLTWLASETLENEKHSKSVLKRVSQLVFELQKVNPLATETSIAESSLRIAEGNIGQAALIIEAEFKRLVNGRKKLDSTRASKLLLIAKFAEAKSQSHAKKHGESHQDTLKLRTLTDRLYRQYAGLTEKPEYSLALATFLGRRGQYTEALAVCAKVQKTVQSGSVAVAASNIVTLGNPSANHLKTARDIIQSYLDADPDSYTANWAMAAIHAASGSPAKSEPIYRKLLSVNKANVSVLNNLAWTMAMQDHNLEESLAMINSAIDKAGPMAPLLDTRGTILLRLNRTKEALVDLEQAVAENPATLHQYHLAMAYLAAGNRSAAEQTLQKAEKAGLSRRTLHRLEQPGYLELKRKLNVETTHYDDNWRPAGIFSRTGKKCLIQLTSVARVGYLRSNA